jgi:hypothetical protein
VAKINLILSIQPCEVEVGVSFKEIDGGFELNYGMIDTGAELSLFPKKWLNTAQHKILKENVSLEQAGIARQGFNAIEAEITLLLEDGQGNQSKPLIVRAWFADTTRVIIGFEGILDRAKLFLDYQENRTGWIEI